MLTLNQATLRRGPQSLLDNVSFTIHAKQKVGLIGQNGSGKSSLFALILNQLELEAGEIFLNKNEQIAHLQQETPALSKSALDYVLDGDTTLRQLQNKLANSSHLSTEQLSKLHESMENHDAYTAEARAAKILYGLGFKEESHHQSVKSFSGGWRMRLNLAQCLMCPSTLLLLDEPTNHLDIDAIFWLEKFLAHYQGTLILISHDRIFLDKLCTHILSLEHKQLTLYKGNYSQFEKIRAEQLSLQQALFEKQQKKKADLMQFVERFRAKASKAKQAQSRLKAIDKLSTIAKAHIDTPFSFGFANGERVYGPLLSLENLSAGYQVDKPILKKVNLRIEPGARIALLGPNGAGKSTLIKCIAGELPPLTGERLTPSPKLRIGYFAQHQLEQLNPKLSALEHLVELDNCISEQQARDFLGGFDFHNDKAINPIAPFSGGEKARLALALIIWRQPNLLLLDEPTNHFDISMRHAIEVALQSYEGAVLIISHDRHLIESTVDEFYLVANQTLTTFNGELKDYEQWLLSKEKGTPKEKSKDVSDHKKDKRTQNRINKIEKELQSLTKKQKEIETELSQEDIYNQPGKLEKILTMQATIHQQMELLEEEWLVLQT